MMTVFWVYYFRSWVRVVGRNAKQAKKAAPLVFSFYYPGLEVDPYWLIAIPADEEQPEFALKEFENTITRGV